MRRTTIFLITIVVCLGLSWAAYQTTITAVRPLAQYVPAGSLLSLEAEDFSGLLNEWTASSQKKQWLKSSNYEVFSRSRLFLRLKGMGDQFATAAGLPPDMNFISEVAGAHSMIAIYDIGNLQFLYVTYLPSAKSMQSKLWQTRAKFELRSVGTAKFYIRRDPESRKEVAFAVVGDYLVLATREDLMAEALQLITDNKGRPIQDEAWWSQAVASAIRKSELRMVLNLEKIVPSPYFRTYWVQQNITDLKQYSTAVVDLFRSDKEYREERVLLRKSASGAGTAIEAEATSDLTRFVPDASIYEAKSAPSADTCIDLLERKLLAQRAGTKLPSQDAPAEPSLSEVVGAPGDLETRIDRLEIKRSTAQTASELKNILDKSHLLASLLVQTTQPDNTGVFIKIHSAVILRAVADWDEAGTRSALIDFVRPSLTTSQLGVGWQSKAGYQQLDGLWSLAAAVRGKYLLLSDDPALMEAMLTAYAQNTKANHPPAVLIAGLNHARERANFARLTGVIDRPNRVQSSLNEGREPQFFSENIASLSSTLAGISTENVVVRDQGSKVLQTVTYSWSR